LYGHRRRIAGDAKQRGVAAVGRDRDREIAVLKLSRRVAAEVESGAVGDVEMSDEQVARIAEVLVAGRARVVQPASPAAPPVAPEVREGMVDLNQVRHAATILAS